MAPVAALAQDKPAADMKAGGAEKKEEAKAPAPVPNKGDTAWMLTSTALVLAMSVPALALFYGGLVRSKNMLSMLMQVFVTFSLVVVLWCIYGYSLAFTEGNAYFGGFDRLFLGGTFDAAKGEFAMAATFSKNTPLYELRVRRVPGDLRRDHLLPDPGRGGRAHQVLGRADLRGAVVYLRLRADRPHGVVLGGPGCLHRPRKPAKKANDTAGLIWQWGALDFAGGTVVHINAGIAGLVGAYLVGKRIGLGREAMTPHNLTMTMIGASLLWFGLVRLQRGFRARGQRLGGARVHEHLPRHRLRGTVVDVRRMAVQGQALDAGRRVRRGGRPGRDHPGSG